MQLARSFLAIALSISLVSISTFTLAIQNVAAQDSKIALQRGYRTGYSDGYMSGYRDSIENTVKKYAVHAEYKTADRAYSKTYGALFDYQDGYRQGFENGYDTGYGKEDFDATIPTTLKLRGAVTTAAIADTPAAGPKTNADDSRALPLVSPAISAKADVPDDALTVLPDTSANTGPALKNGGDEPVISDPASAVQSVINSDAIIIIPAETELVVELLDEMDTRTLREGDSFEARVVSPKEIGGAIIEGRIAKNRRPGRLKRRAELILSFDRIKLSESRWSNFNAIILEVLPVKGDNVKRVDNEGMVQGKRPYKSDATKVGAATGTGVLIGAIIAGPVGAAVGAGVGAAFGVGAIVVERGRYVRLYEKQQLRIKTAYETRIR